MSQGSVLAPKMGSKWVPNRIIDAEGVGKPLDRYLGRYDSALEGILAALGRSPAAPYRLRGTVPGPRGSLINFKPAAR